MAEDRKLPADDVEDVDAASSGVPADTGAAPAPPSSEASPSPDQPADAAKPAGRARARKPKAAAAGEAAAGKKPRARKPAAAKAQDKAEAEKPAAAEKAAKPAATPRAAKAKPSGPAPVVRAQAKYVRTSARKARMVCNNIRGKSVTEAQAILAFAPRAVARDWAKLLNSAVANAEHNHELVGDDLRIKEAFADEGPTLKRFRPRAMGRATPIHKRTSHLTITLTPRD